jgi:hypothetical protein
MIANDSQEELLHILWLEIEVSLEKPMTLESVIGNRGPIRKGFLEAGVTDSSVEGAVNAMHARLLAEKGMEEQGVSIEATYIAEIAADGLEREIYQDADIRPNLLSDPRHRGVWYQSGIAWYGDDA